MIFDQPCIRAKISSIEQACQVALSAPATQLMVKTNPQKEPTSYLLRSKAGFEDREIFYLQEQKDLHRSTSLSIRF